MSTQHQVIVSTHLLGTENFNEIDPVCQQFSARWEEIGSNLGIKRYIVETIRQDFKYCGKKMSELIAVWLRRESDGQPLPSWRALCDAIASVDRTGAERIASKHQCDCIQCKEAAQKRRVVVAKRIVVTSSKVSPHDILKSHIPAIIEVIVDTEKLADNLAAVDLIPQSVKDNVSTTLGISLYQRASRLMNEVHRPMKLYDESQTLQSLCRVLKRQGNPALARIADTILRELGIDVCENIPPNSAEDKSQEMRSQEVKKQEIVTEETDTQASENELEGSTSSKIIQCIVFVINEKKPALSRLFDNNMETVAEEMLQARVITASIERNPTSDAIINSFLSAFEFMDELEDIEKHYVKFLSVFYKIGGPFVPAGDMIKKHVLKKVNSELGIELKLVNI